MVKAYEVVINSFSEDDRQFILNEINDKNAKFKATRTMSESTYFRRKKKIAKQFQEKLEWYLSFKK